MKRSKLLIVVGVLFLGLLYAKGVSAHEPHECPAGLPDEGLISEHLDQAEISGGKLTFEALFSAGQKLFVAQFNTCDGQGRPATTGTGEHREPDEPAFIRTSSPEANSCAGCHAQPRKGGGGDFARLRWMIWPMSLSWRTPSIL